MPSLTIKPVVESPDELAAFLSATVEARDLGTTPQPRWSGEFLRDTVLGRPDGTAEHALGAYADGKLVGTVMAIPFAMFVGDKKLQGAYGSWLAVEAEGIRQLAAPRLIVELCKRLRAHGAHFIVGVTHRSGPRIGFDFWSSFARAFPSQVKVGPEMKYWMRIVDGRSLAAGLKSPLFKLAATCARAWPVREGRPAPEVRYYTDDDFAGCADLFFRMPARMRTAPNRADFAGDGNCAARPQTLVLDRGNGVEAAASFYLQPMNDAAPFQAGVIEHLVYRRQTGGLSVLLHATLRRLLEAGASFASLPIAPGQPIAQLLAAGFVPYGADHYVVFLPLTDEAPRELSRSLLLPLL